MGPLKATNRSVHLQEFFIDSDLVHGNHRKIPPIDMALAFGNT